MLLQKSHARSTLCWFYFFFLNRNSMSILVLSKLISSSSLTATKKSKFRKGQTVDSWKKLELWFSTDSLWAFNCKSLAIGPLENKKKKSIERKLSKYQLTHEEACSRTVSCYSLKHIFYGGHRNSHSHLPYNSVLVIISFSEAVDKSSWSSALSILPCVLALGYRDKKK